MNKIKITLYALAIPIGAFLFVYGEYDDSPGGQLLGLAITIVGLIVLVKSRLKNK